MRAEVGNPATFYFKPWERKLQAAYGGHVCGHHPEPLALELPDDWQERILEIAREMHNGKRGPAEVDSGMINATYALLDDARAKGRNDSGYKLGENAGIDPAVMKMQRNLFRFSGAKTFTQLLDMNSKLTKDGKTQPWEAFKADVLALNNQYNVNHLQAKFQTARQAAHHARNWEKYQEQSHIFPNLKYKTVGDARVRDEHAAINNTIAPIDHDFWSKYYPPNGWRCRCYVVQTAERATVVPDEVPEVRPEFRVNVGAEQELFPEEPGAGARQHTYFVIANKYGNKTMQQAFERAKLSTPYTPVYRAKNKALVEVSPFADERELEANFHAATVIADKLATGVKIRPHIDPKVLPGISNPEYEINGHIADRKAIKGYRGISSAFDAVKKQGGASIVFDLAEFGDWEPEGFVRGLKGKLSAYKSSWVQEIFIISGQKAEMVKPADVLGNHLEVMKRLKKMKAD